jgi:type IX secretion system PorP/SprF family membrane protein
MEVKYIHMKRKLLSVFCLLVSLGMYGQLTPVSDQYILNPLTINPAYAGGRGALNVAAFYRRQWIGITGAPETATLSADAPLLDGKLGVGLTIVNDKIGVTKQTSFNTNYSYKIKMGEGNLSFGLGAGLITTHTSWSDLVVLDPGDEYYLINSSVFVVPAFSFGLYYNRQNYFAGFSIPKLLGYKFDFNLNRYSIKVDPGQYYYLFNTGYVFDISSKMKFFPSTLISFSPGNRIMFDLNAHFSFYDRMWIGASYRSNSSIGGLFQFAINNQLKIAYSYFFDFSNLERYSSGSHEIMIRYEFHYKVNVVNPLIF